MKNKQLLSGLFLSITSIAATHGAETTQEIVESQVCAVMEDKEYIRSIFQQCESLGYNFREKTAELTSIKMEDEPSAVLFALLIAETQEDKAISLMKAYPALNSLDAIVKSEGYDKKYIIRHRINGTHNYILQTEGLTVTEGTYAPQWVKKHVADIAKGKHSFPSDWGDSHRLGEYALVFDRKKVLEYILEQKYSIAEVKDKHNSVDFCENPLFNELMIKDPWWTLRDLLKIESTSDLKYKSTNNILDSLLYSPVITVDDLKPGSYGYTIIQSCYNDQELRGSSNKSNSKNEHVNNLYDTLREAKKCKPGYNSYLGSNSYLYLDKLPPDFMIWKDYLKNSDMPLSHINSLRSRFEKSIEVAIQGEQETISNEKQKANRSWIGFCTMSENEDKTYETYFKDTYQKKIDLAENKIQKLDQQKINILIFLDSIIPTAATQIIQSYNEKFANLNAFGEGEKMFRNQEEYLQSVENFRKNNYKGIFGSLLTSEDPAEEGRLLWLSIPQDVINKCRTPFELLKSIGSSRY